MKVRIYLPRRVLSTKNCSFGGDDYCEVSSKFKAAHIKVMCWWIAWKFGALCRASVPKRKKLQNFGYFSVFVRELVINYSLLCLGARKTRFYTWPLHAVGL